MKNYLIIFALLINVGALAQSRNAQDRIESAKIAFITKRVNLTPKQAEKFWPIYNEYSAHKRELFKEALMAKRKAESDGISEEESRKLLDLRMKLKEQELELDKNYSEKFTRVITNKQLLELRRAEDDFRKMLLERLKKRNGNIQD